MALKIQFLCQSMFYNFFIFPEGTSSRAQVLQLQNQLKDCKDRIASIQQEKAILGLSAAQVCASFPYNNNYLIDWLISRRRPNL